MFCVCVPFTYCRFYNLRSLCLAFHEPILQIRYTHHVEGVWQEGTRGCEAKSFLVGNDAQLWFAKSHAEKNGRIMAWMVWHECLALSLLERSCSAAKALVSLSACYGLLSTQIFLCRKTMVCAVIFFRQNDDPLPFTDRNTEEPCPIAILERLPLLFLCIASCIGSQETQKSVFVLT